MINLLTTAGDCVLFSLIDVASSTFCTSDLDVGNLSSSVQGHSFIDISLLSSPLFS